MVTNSIGEPIRIADVIGGHVHPAACVTHSGTTLVAYNKEGGGGRELLLSHSTDGGMTWSRSVPIPVIRDCSIYPGSLTTLSDGRILLNWSCYRETGETLWREPQFSLSHDEGETWSKPQSYPIADHTNYTCMRHAVVEWSTAQWVCPFYDRTVLYDQGTNQILPFGDGRNHGMVPIVRTGDGTLISGAPQANAPVPVGVPGDMVRGLRSTDGGATWQALGVFPHFGVAGYDLTVLTNNWIILTYIVYGVGHDGEYSYELAVSRDNGVTWGFDAAFEVHNPGRRIMGRGWPRLVQIDDGTLGTVFYDLEQEQPGGPGVFVVRTPLAKLG
ncbi:MAG: sialidase family protein [Candidatus Poribacteria bacterium]|nr:sialidase family protein [Candidatus Poribacteria bacterium]